MKKAQKNNAVDLERLADTKRSSSLTMTTRSVNSLKTQRRRALKASLLSGGNSTSSSHLAPEKFTKENLGSYTFSV